MGWLFPRQINLTFGRRSRRLHQYPACGGQGPCRDRQAARRAFWDDCGPANRLNPACQHADPGERGAAAGDVLDVTTDGPLQPTDPQPEADASRMQECLQIFIAAPLRRPNSSGRNDNTNGGRRRPAHPTSASITIFPVATSTTEMFETGCSCLAI